MKENFVLFALRLFLFSCSLFFISSVSAQDINISIKIINEKREPVAAASITVTDRLDSLQVFKKIADSSGIANFVLVKGHQYSISITSVNYQPFDKGIIASGEQTRFTFLAEPFPKTLGGVVVTSQKPLMRQEDDKTIVDPEALAATSTSGYEVIEKTPGLFVDQDGNIYINSLSPATIYINGREMKMSVSDVATMLKSLPPNSIDRIEILKTPSAKYDASGTGGIVNVVLKKGVKIGMTGSVTGGWQMGKYSNEFIGFNLNNNNGKKSSYLNINYNRRVSYEQIKTDRIFAPDSLLSQDAGTKYPSDSYYAGFGISFQLNKKWDLSYDGRISLNNFDNKTNNRSIISKISTGQVLTNNLAKVGNNGSSFLLTNGITTRYKIDSLGSEWSNDISYTYARNNADQDFVTLFDIPTIPEVGGDGNNLSNRNFLAAQTDLKLKLHHQVTLETGLKTSVMDFKSVSNYYKGFGSGRSKDFARTNTFNYHENINSAYLQASKSIKDIIIKAGLRMENTNMKGTQVIPDDTSFSIHRTDLFPYIYISKKVMVIAGYELRAYLVYRRTITRPVYEQLNPFPRYVDQYVTEVGNPSLRPQFTQNYEANISVDERPLLAIGVNDTKDIFTNVIYQADSTKSQAYKTYDNLGKNKEWYLRGLGAIPPGKRYFFVVGGQYNHNMYDGLYENKPLIFSKGTWTFFTFHSYKIDKLSQVTLFGFIRLKGQQQFYELSSFGALNSSINRQFMKQKLIVTLSVNDIFSTNRNDFMINQGSVNASGFRKGDTRRFGINLRYNFGIRKKESTPDMFNINENN
ncbi:MAG: outer membrane beta-barrel protein [Chitinophagaceae bacterium]